MRRHHALQWFVAGLLATTGCQCGSDSGGASGVLSDVDPDAGADSGVQADVTDPGGSGDGGASDMDAGPVALDAGDGTGDNGNEGTGTDDAGTPPAADAGQDAEVEAGPEPVVEAADIRLNEVVTWTLSDWSHSDTGVDRFDGTAGTGVVNSNDEYVELYNAGNLAADMTGWQLEVHDGSDSTTVVGAAGDHILTYSPGSSRTALQPGGYMLIGNPEGATSADAWIVLKDADGFVVDEVEIGGLSESLDANMRGDGEDNGAPYAGRNARALGLFQQAVAFVEGNESTGDPDFDNWELQHATPLAENVPPAPGGDTTPPQLAEDGEPRVAGTDVAVSAPLFFRFNEPIDGNSVFGNLSVTASRTVGSPPPAPDMSGAFTFELSDGDSTLTVTPAGVMPHDADVRITLASGAEGIKDMAGNPLQSDIVADFHTEDAPPDAVTVINEVLVDPQQRYEATGFDGNVSAGSGGSVDEWIEVFHNDPAVTDFSEWRLIVYRGPNSFAAARYDHSFAELAAISTTVVRVVGTGTLDAVAQGDYLVVGNPPGSLPNDVYLELRNPAGTLVDSVEVGGQPGQDRGGDGTNNGAPGSGQDGAATDASDESISRVPNAFDTGANPGNFCRATATLGAANTACDID